MNDEIWLLRRENRTITESKSMFKVAASVPSGATITKALTFLKVPQSRLNFVDVDFATNG